MRFRTAVALALGIALHFSDAAISAHHSFAGEFDNSIAINLQGVVTGVEMVNPHSFIYVDVTTPGGVERWALEGPAPRQVLRMGLDLHFLKAGDEVGACGYLGRSDLVTKRTELLSAAGAARKLQAAVLTMPTRKPLVWNNYHQGKCGLDK